MSTRINFLPYREQARKAARRQFTILAGGVLGLGVAVALAGHGVIAGYQVNQESRNSFLAAENRALDTEIEEIRRLKTEIEALKARKGVIESLQSDRAAAVQILDQLVRLAPEGVYLKTIKQTGINVNVVGYAASNDLVSAFMVAINTSEFIEVPTLVEIKSTTVGERKLFEFNLNFSLRRPKAIDPKLAAKPGRVAAPALAASTPAQAASK